MLHEYRCPVCGRVLHIRTFYDDIGRLEEVAVTCRCGYEWIKSYGRETERRGEERE